MNDMNDNLVPENFILKPYKQKSGLGYSKICLYLLAISMSMILLDDLTTTLDVVIGEQCENKTSSTVTLGVSMLLYMIILKSSHS